MSKQKEDPDTSRWKTISAEELAASRRQAACERLAGPKGWLVELIGILQEGLERKLADHSLDAGARDVAETDLQTLQTQFPALLELLNQLPSGSSKSAFSMIFYLLLAVRGRKGKTAEGDIRKLQAAAAREAKAGLDAEKHKIAAQYVHLPEKEALPLINAELKKRRLSKMSRSVFYRIRKSRS